MTIYECVVCHALWLKRDELRQYKDITDEYLCWLDVDLWQKEEHHGVTPSEHTCPECDKTLYNVDYHGSHIVLPVCFECKGVWLEESTREKLFQYLEDQITNETVAGYLKEIGHDAMDVIAGREKLTDEIRDLKTILVLLEYRIFSKFPMLERFLSDFPK